MAVDGVVSKMMEAGCICDLKISYYVGQVKLSAQDLGLDDSDLPDELYSLGRRRLIDRERINQFKKVESRARRALSSRSWDFPATSCGRFVVATYIDEVNDALLKEKEAFIDEMRAFFEEYPALRQEMLGRWQEHIAELWSKVNGDVPYEEFVQRTLTAIDALYPTTDDLARRFQFRWDWYSITFPTGESYSWGQQRADIRKEAMLKYRAYAERSVANTMETIVAALREEAVKVTEMFAELIKEQGEPREVHHKQLQGLRDFIDRFERMNFIGDRSVAAAVAKLRKAVPQHVCYLNDAESGGIRMRMREALAKVHEAATDVAKVTTVVGKFLEYGRSVDDD